MAAMSCTQQIHLRLAQQLDRDGPGATLLHHHWFVTKDTDIRFDVQIQRGADSSLQLGGLVGWKGWFNGLNARITKTMLCAMAKGILCPIAL